MKIAKANALRWFGYVLRAEEDNPVKMALNFELRGKRKKVQLMRIRKENVKDRLCKAHLKEEDASNCTKWRKCVRTLKNG